MIHYITSSKNGFALAGALQHYKIPYDYNPYRKFGKKKVHNGYGASVIDMTLEESTKHECVSLSDLLYRMQEKYKTTYDFAIIGEFHY
jgi:hypothetical protein